MRLLVYYHDAFLPYSRYLVQGLLESGELESVTICGPRATAENSIFSQGSALGADPRLIQVKSKRINWKWFTYKEISQILKKHRPDVFLILDEALSWNVLCGSLAARKVLGTACTPVFYAFENIKQDPPAAWFFQHPSPRNFLALAKKTFRAVFFDWCLMPVRKRANPKGLYAYPECAEVIHRHGWQPEMKEAWFPVDTKTFMQEPLPEAGKELTAAYSIPPGCKVIGFAGRFIKDKGLESLVRGMSLIKSPAMLLLIGAGPEEDRLKAVAQETGVAQKICWCGPMSSDRIRAHYGIMDLLILPSLTGTFWKEQLGRVLLEAMSAGVNVAGSSSGAIPYVIGNPQFVFAEGDSASLARTVDHALAHPRSALELKARASLASTETFVSIIKELCTS